MKNKTLIFLFSFLLSSVFSLTIFSNELEKPWQDAQTALIIDPYFKNEIVWDELKKEPRLIAIIHKATEGKRADPLYAERKKEALKRSYLWGSYHLGKPGNPIEQADFYLQTVNPQANEAMALDLEGLDEKQFMSLENAEKFIQRIFEKTGRYPLLYVNHKVMGAISELSRKSIFSKTPLWYARFVEKIENFPQKIWSSYTLWQFSSEIKVQYSIPGTKSDMDINVYRGSIGELKKNWPLN